MIEDSWIFFLYLLLVLMSLGICSTLVGLVVEAVMVKRRRSVQAVRRFKQISASIGIGAMTLFMLIPWPNQPEWAYIKRVEGFLATLGGVAMGLILAYYLGFKVKKEWKKE